eukprot:6186325-Pleurochrysis_carterae.AAC.2
MKGCTSPRVPKQISSTFVPLPSAPAVPCAGALILAVCVIVGLQAAAKRGALPCVLAVTPSELPSESACFAAT